MATRNSRTRSSKSRESHGTAVRSKVRTISARAFRDREFAMRDVSSMVRDVLEGAVDGVEDSLPKSSKGVLRGIFDGMKEGVRAVASAGSAAMDELRDTRAAKGAGRMMDDAADSIAPRRGRRAGGGTARTGAGRRSGVRARSGASKKRR